MSVDNMAELNKLVVLLVRNDIPFEIGAWNIVGHPTWQICSPSWKDKRIDAVCHEFSYGGKSGLIEIMSEKEDDVVGWLTAEEALLYFLKFKEEEK